MTTTAPRLSDQPRRVLIVLAVLASATLAATALSGITGMLGVVLVLALTAIKVWLIVADYMECRRGPVWLRALWFGWGAIVFVGMAVLLTV